MFFSATIEGGFLFIYFFPQETDNCVFKETKQLCQQMEEKMLYLK